MTAIPIPRPCRTIWSVRRSVRPWKPARATPPVIPIPWPSGSSTPPSYIYQNNQLVGTIGIADINDYDYIEKYGENLYNFLEGGTVVASEAKVRQGMLETSNVNVVNEMVNMIKIQRAYEAGQKVITSIDSTLGLAVNLGKVK